MPTPRKRKKNKNKKKRHPNPKRTEISVKEGKKIFEDIKKLAVVEQLGEVTPHQHNMPELLMEFVKDELETFVKQDDKRMLMSACITCWNIGCNGDKEVMEKQLQDICYKVSASPEMQQSMRRLIERKVTHYNEYQYFITDYEIERNDVLGTWDLTLSSFDITKLAGMKDEILGNL